MTEEWVDTLTAKLYDELRMLAHAQLRREHDGHTLGTTALVHEAWLRLSSAQLMAPQNTRQFFALASTTMRRVLVDHARRVRTIKRGAGIAPQTIEEYTAFLSPIEADEMVVLDEALSRLAAQNPRAAHVVELRFFGGLREEEIAAQLGISPKTVQRDWVAARAWLRKEVSRELTVFGT